MTTSELGETLRANNIHPDAVRLGSGLPDADEQYCIVPYGHQWHVYYAERGQKSNLQVFESEDAACRYLLAILKEDTSAWLKR